jgi:pimeloyl-ACP methyl ester carboxylesterase
LYAAPKPGRAIPFACAELPQTEVPQGVTTATTAYSEQTVQVAGKQVRLLEGGAGAPLVVLHHSTGNVGWAPIHEQLAESFKVLAFDMPGYGQSERPEWARDPRDIAIMMLQALDRLGLQGVTLLGTGLGGFVAAEMATMNRSRLASLVIIGAAGIQPRDGEIVDQMLIDYDEYVKAGFRNDEAFAEVFGESLAPEVKQLWDFSREMTARLTWKPYMFNRRMVPLLSGIDIPTLIIWGSEDVIVPIDVAHQYRENIPGAKLEVVIGAGHLVELEEPAKVASLVAAHAKKS